VLTQVTLIDMTGAAAKADMTVVIQGNRIVTLGSSKQVRPPKDAQVINAQGKFLIPGLWDMHLHLTIIPDQTVSRDVLVPLLVAHGVTGVRDMGGDWQRIQELRKSITDGQLLGPRIIAPGPFVDGPQQPTDYVLPVNNEEEARQAVRKLKSQGVDFIKVQAGLSLPIWQAVIAEAKQQSILVAGHIPQQISAFEIARSTQQSVEHISPVLPGDAGLLLACSSKEAELRDEMLKIEKAAQEANADRQALRQRQRTLQMQMITTYNQEKCASLLSLLAKNHIVAVPTQIFGKRFAPLDASDLPMEDALRFAPRSMRERWANRRNAIIKNSTPEDFLFRKMIFEKSRSLVGAIHQAGVKLMAGTDAIDGYVLPGLSLHQELALMVEAGLTPMEALQTATYNPAKYLGMLNSIGTIEQGKIADLVLLEANPLENINNTQKIAAVILAGKLIDKAELQKILSAIEMAASKK
ncbi:MAG: amidohydrolase family protein, partial [Acidobacteriota bacterium]